MSRETRDAPTRSPGLPRGFHSDKKKPSGLDLLANLFTGQAKEVYGKARRGIKKISTYGLKLYNRVLDSNSCPMKQGKV
jgi:hypothetical protein